MTNHFSPPLPEPLASYFLNADRTTTAALFAPDAEVKDEGQRHSGLAEIRHWLQAVEKRYQPRYHVLSAERSGQMTIVTFEVSGTFPGSPAVLRQAFLLDSEGRISCLETL